MKVFRIIVQIIGMIAVICSLIPLLAYDNWWVRVFDFVHVQLSVLTLVAILLYVFVFKWRGFRDYLIMTVLIGCFIFQVSVVWPYFPFSEESMSDSIGDGTELKLLVSNVLQKNSKYSKLTDHVLESKPDVALFMETDQKWIDHLHQTLDSIFPYHTEAALDNTYGIILMSKKELQDSRIEYQVDDRIPSVHTKVEIENNRIIQLYAIHPTPPMPQHNDMSTDRDIEMMKTAFLARSSDLPVVVMGDFNDVPWSDTTELVQQIGGLLDPRKGRAFFSTFKSGNWLMRWPLDHVLASEEFRYLSSETLGSLGSDHDLYEVVLSYEPQHASDQQPDPLTDDQYANAIQQMNASGYEDFMGRLPERFLKDLPEKIRDMVNFKKDSVTIE